MKHFKVLLSLMVVLTSRKCSTFAKGFGLPRESECEDTGQTINGDKKVYTPKTCGPTYCKITTSSGRKADDFSCTIGNYRGSIPTCQNIQWSLSSMASRWRSSQVNLEDVCQASLASVDLYMFSCKGLNIEEVSLNFTFNLPICGKDFSDEHDAVMVGFNAKNDSIHNYFAIHPICRVFYYGKNNFSGFSAKDSMQISYDCMGIGLQEEYPEVYYYLSLTSYPLGTSLNYTLVYMDVSEGSMRLIAAAWRSTRRIHVVFLPIAGVTRYLLRAEGNGFSFETNVSSSVVEITDIGPLANVVTVKVKPIEWEEGMCASTDKLCSAIQVTLHDRRQIDVIVEPDPQPTQPPEIRAAKPGMLWMMVVIVVLGVIIIIVLTGATLCIIRYMRAVVPSGTCTLLTVVSPSKAANRVRKTLQKAGYKVTDFLHDHVLVNTGDLQDQQARLVSILKKMDVVLIFIHPTLAELDVWKDVQTLLQVILECGLVNKTKTSKIKVISLEGKGHARVRPSEIFGNSLKGCRSVVKEILEALDTATYFMPEDEQKLMEELKEFSAQSLKHGNKRQQILVGYKKGDDEEMVSLISDVPAELHNTNTVSLVSEVTTDPDNCVQSPHPFGIQNRQHSSSDAEDAVGRIVTAHIHHPVDGQNGLSVSSHKMDGVGMSETSINETNTGLGEQRCHDDVRISQPWGRQNVPEPSSRQNIPQPYNRQSIPQPHEFSGQVSLPRRMSCQCYFGATPFSGSEQSDEVDTEVKAVVGQLSGDEGDTSAQSFPPEFRHSPEGCETCSSIPVGGREALSDPGDADETAVKMRVPVATAQSRSEVVVERRLPEQRNTEQLSHQSPSRSNHLGIPNHLGVPNQMGTPNHLEDSRQSSRPNQVGERPHEVRQVYEADPATAGDNVCSCEDQENTFHSDSQHCASGCFHCHNERTGGNKFNQTNPVSANNNACRREGEENSFHSNPQHCAPGCFHLHHEHAGENNNVDPREGEENSFHSNPQHCTSRCFRLHHEHAGENNLCPREGEENSFHSNPQHCTSGCFHHRHDRARGNMFNQTNPVSADGVCCREGEQVSFPSDLQYCTTECSHLGHEHSRENMSNQRDPVSANNDNVSHTEGEEKNLHSYLQLHTTVHSHLSHDPTSSDQPLLEDDKIRGNSSHTAEEIQFTPAGPQQSVVRGPPAKFVKTVHCQDNCRLPDVLARDGSARPLVNQRRQPDIRCHWIIPEGPCHWIIPEGPCLSGQEKLPASTESLFDRRGNSCSSDEDGCSGETGMEQHLGAVGGRAENGRYDYRAGDARNHGLYGEDSHRDQGVFHEELGQHHGAELDQHHRSRLDQRCKAGSDQHHGARLDQHHGAKLDHPHRAGYVDGTERQAVYPPGHNLPQYPYPRADGTERQAVYPPGHNLPQHPYPRADGTERQAVYPPGHNLPQHPYPHADGTERQAVYPPGHNLLWQPYPRADGTERQAVYPPGHNLLWQPYPHADGAERQAVYPPGHNLPQQSYPQIQGINQQQDRRCLLRRTHKHEEGVESSDEESN